MASSASMTAIRHATVAWSVPSGKKSVKMDWLPRRLGTTRVGGPLRIVREHEIDSALLA